MGCRLWPYRLHRYDTCHDVDTNAVNHLAVQMCPVVARSRLSAEICGGVAAEGAQHAKWRWSRLRHCGHAGTITENFFYPCRLQSSGTSSAGPVC